MFTSKSSEIYRSCYNTMALRVAWLFTVCAHLIMRTIYCIAHQAAATAAAAAAKNELLNVWFYYDYDYYCCPGVRSRPGLHLHRPQEQRKNYPPSQFGMAHSAHVSPIRHRRIRIFSLVSRLALLFRCILLISLNDDRNGKFSNKKKKKQFNYACAVTLVLQCVCARALFPFL